MLLYEIYVVSLKYKNETFKEEQEWRLFFSQQIYKNAKWIYGDEEIETIVYDDMLKVIKNKIAFNVISDDLIPFYPINFTEISPNPIKQVIVYK